MLTSIVEFVSREGWEECCWTDDALAFKKIYPGHQFNAKSKKWSQRIKVSDDSMEMMINRGQTRQALTQGCVNLVV